MPRIVAFDVDKVLTNFDNVCTSEELYQAIRAILKGSSDEVVLEKLKSTKVTLSDITKLREAIPKDETMKRHHARFEARREEHPDVLVEEYADLVKASHASGAKVVVCTSRGVGSKARTEKVLEPLSEYFDCILYQEDGGLLKNGKHNTAKGRALKTLIKDGEKVDLTFYDDRQDYLDQVELVLGREHVLHLHLVPIKKNDWTIEDFVKGATVE